MSQKLPALHELHHDIQEAFKNDQLNLLLNAQTPDNWIKKHPFIDKVRYLPIDKVEFLLTRIFQQWRIEILAEGQLFNSVYVRVRLHYKNPLTGDWGYHDGIGAVGIQTDAGETASNLNAIKQDAVMKALPAAESYAIKDAAEKLGRLFGKDLNRKDTIGFEGAYNKSEKPELTDEIRLEVNLCKDDFELNEIIDKHSCFVSDLEFKELVLQKRRSFNPDLEI